MACKKCNSNRVAGVSGKTSDLCHVSMGNKEHDGYVPKGMGIGGGDYIDFMWCLDCGQISGTFPRPLCVLEQ